MLHALTTPVLKSVVLGGLLLGAGLGAAKIKSSDCCSSSMHRLSLHAPVQEGALYLTAFEDGDVRVKLHDGALRPIAFEIRASVNDGCRWLGVETLEPLDQHTYSYSYRETILECDPGATPFLKTPRTGVVVVHDD
jgi:hypothetical protein